MSDFSVSEESGSDSDAPRSRKRGGKSFGGAKTVIQEKIAPNLVPIPTIEYEEPLVIDTPPLIKNPAHHMDVVKRVYPNFETHRPIPVYCHVTNRYYVVPAYYVVQHHERVNKELEEFDRTYVCPLPKPTWYTPSNLRELCAKHGYRIPNDDTPLIATITRVVVSTYQAVSGAGKAALNEIQEQMRAILDGKPYPPKVFPHQIAFNCIPQIPQSAAFTDNGYTSEEMKMVNETKKIMGDDSIQVTATTVRVPVLNSHSESVNVETKKKLTADEARALLAKAPGVIVQDDPAAQLYPLATNATGKYETFVGRIREDISHPSALDMWIVADNLLKGAASNAVQIAELL